MENTIITIDGPTASGKSTLSRMLAKKLNYYHIYSGLLYRALTYVLLNDFGYTLETIADVSPKDSAAVLNSERFNYSYNGGEKIIFDGNDITSQLKNNLIDQAASIVSTNKSVRNAIDNMQRMIANDYNAVIDGRDAGTVVFPHADFKFFLTADPLVRAKRWQAQQAKQGNKASFEDAKQFVAMRDERDSAREVAPLKPAADAIIIDNSTMSSDQTLENILEKIK